MAAMSPLRLVGTVDARLEPAMRQDNAVKPLTSLNIPHGRVLTSFNELDEMGLSGTVPRVADDNSIDPEEDDPTFDIYDAYFRPMTYDSDMQDEESRLSFLKNRDALLQALDSPEKSSSDPPTDDSMLRPRPVDQMMGNTSVTAPNRLLDADMRAALGVAPTPPEKPRSMDSYFGQQHTPELKASGALGPDSTSRTITASPTSARAPSTPHGAAHLARRDMVSSPLRNGGGGGVTSPRVFRPAALHEDTLSEPAPNVYGSPIVATAMDTSEHALPEKAQLFQQWTTLLTDRSGSSRMRKKAVQLVHTGVPNALRGRVWMMLAEGKSQRPEGVFERYLGECAQSLREPEKFPFSQLLERDLDVYFPRSQPFQGLNGTTRDDIRKILHAFAYMRSDLGYTEGMCLVVGLLLTHLETEDTFWMLEEIVQKFGMAGLYSGDRQVLQIDNMVVDEMLRITDAALHQRLQELHIEPVMFLPGWIFPMYVRTLPWATLVRVWDMFFCYGRTFLLRTAVAIICLNRDVLLSMTSEEDRKRALRHLVFVPPEKLSVATVLPRALHVPVTDKEIIKMAATAEKLAGLASRDDPSRIAEDATQLRLQGKLVSKRTMRLLTGRRRTKA